ncbi:MAG TPA: hypothetical protein VLJ58_07495 [Ramlibacter sp.]|nr:hypothetical protein [Ramlibacter sp.]
MDLQFVSETVRRVAMPAPEVTLRHLRSHAEIGAILHLRENIDLSVHVAADSNFLELEKKETNAAWFSRSSLKGTPLEPSGSFPWAIG